MGEKIGIIGAGGWGTAVAKVLAECGHEVSLWCHESSLASEIRESGSNERYLPGVALPRSIVADPDPLAVATGKDAIFLAVPSPYLMGVVRRILIAPNVLEGETMVVVLTKGFIPSPSGPRPILETLEDHLPGFFRGNTVYLAGPSHAEEVSRGKITGLIAASQNGRNAIRTRELFRGSRVLVFPSLDVTGVQVCAAAKNVVAIAFGMLDAIVGAAQSGSADRGDTFGDNTESLLLAAGLNEMQTLGVAMGATHPETFTSIAGVGDLDVTCRSVHGRNRRFGRDIVEKDVLAPFKDLDDLLSRLGELAYLPEGAVACKQVSILAAERKLDLPIMGGVYRILNREAAPLEVLEGYLTQMGAAL
jgi:Glycerol-3-phosphate dehydrogenase